MGGFSIGYGIGVGPRTAAFDADALAYFQTAGVTDETAKIQINSFVKEIKNLGLWSSMISWPLRSTQNAGTGTTAYSLGGLQTASITMSGGSWLSDGFSLSNSQYGSSTLSSPDQDVSLLICARGDGSTYGSFPHVFGIQESTNWVANQICIGANGNNTQMGTFHRNSTTATGYSTNGTNPLNASSTFTFLVGNAKVANLLNYRIVTTGTVVSSTAATAGTATLNRLQLNGRWAGSLALANPIIVAFCAIISPNISGSETSFYNAYKSSMGDGLSLP